MKTTKKAASVLLAGALAASMSCVVPALASAAPAIPAAVEASATYTALAVKTVKRSCKVGDKHPLTFKVGKKKIKNSKVSWKSSNKKIATVSKKGVITAKKAGTVTITAKYKKTTIKYKVTVKAGQTVDQAAAEFNAAVKEMKEMLKKYGSSTVENGQTIWRASDKVEEGDDSKLPVTFEYNEATKQFAVSATLAVPASAGDKSGTYTVKFVFSDNYADKDCTLVSSFNGKEVASVAMKKSELNLNNIPELAKDGNDFLFNLIAKGSIQQATQSATGLDRLKKFGFATIDSEYDQAAETFNDTVTTFKTAIMEIKPVVENGETIYRLPSNNSGKYDGITASYGYNATTREFFVIINVTNKTNDTFTVELDYSDNYTDKDCTLTSYKDGKQVKTVKMAKSEFNEASIPVLSDDGQEAMVYGLVLTGMVNQIANNPVATAMFQNLGFATIDETANGEKAAFDAMASGLKKELKEYGSIVEGEQNIYGRVTEQKRDEGTLTTSQEYNETTGEFAASVGIDTPATSPAGAQNYSIRLAFSDKFADKDCTITARKNGEVVKTVTMKKSELKASAMPSLGDDAKDKLVFALIEEAAAEQFKGNIVAAGILMDLGFTSISK